jgi:hypothetical protein
VLKKLNQVSFVPIIESLEERQQNAVEKRTKQEGYKLRKNELTLIKWEIVR